MKNKVLVELIVPEIEESYNIYLPINKRMGNLVVLLTKAINDINFINFINGNCTIYNKETGDKYTDNLLVRETNIRNGTVLVLIKD